MNNLEYFKLLPEIMSYEDINEEFLRFIENLYLMNSMSENLDILVELSSRQWNTYKLAYKSIRDVITEYLIKNINLNSDEDIDSAIRISLALGLKDVYDFILSKVDNISNDNVVELLKEYQSEIKDISDPYCSI